MGKLIQQAFNHSNIVEVTESALNEDKLVTVDGMQIGSGYFDKAFINNGAKQTIEYTDISIILIDGKLEKLDTIAPILQQLPKVAIVADHFHSSVVSILRDNYNKNAIDIALIKSPGFGTHRRELMKDLSLYTGSKLFKQGEKYNKVGDVKKIKALNVGEKFTTITVSKINEETKTKVSELKDFLKTKNNKDMDIRQLKDRIAGLSGKISVINVGGKSELEMKERKDRYDDAVLATQCGLEEGIIEGAGLTFIKIYNDLLNTLKYKDNPFLGCLTFPAYTIFVNSSGKVNFEPDEDLFALNIVDPVKVARCALENAVSVSRTLLSSSHLVLNELQWR